MHMKILSDCNNPSEINKCQSWFTGPFGRWCRKWPRSRWVAWWGTSWRMQRLGAKPHPCNKPNQFNYIPSPSKNQKTFYFVTKTFITRNRSKKLLTFQATYRPRWWSWWPTTPMRRRWPRIRGSSPWPCPRCTCRTARRTGRPCRSTSPSIPHRRRLSGTRNWRSSPPGAISCWSSRRWRSPDTATTRIRQTYRIVGKFDLRSTGASCRTSTWLISWRCCRIWPVRSPRRTISGWSTCRPARVSSGRPRRSAAGTFWWRNGRHRGREAPNRRRHWFCKVTPYRKQTIITYSPCPKTLASNFVLPENSIFWTIIISKQKTYTNNVNYRHETCKIAALISVSQF